MINNNNKKEIKKIFFDRLIKFSIEVIDLCRLFEKDYLIKSILDQLIRSATSIGANIIEAQASRSKLDYINFFQIALKSANETKYWLILIKSINKKSEINWKIEILQKELIEICNIIASSLLTLKGNK